MYRNIYLGKTVGKIRAKQDEKKSDRAFRANQPLCPPEPKSPHTPMDTLL